MTSATTAVWSILYVCPPSEPTEVAGILLVDTATDRLLARLKQRLSTLNEDIDLIWGSFAEDLAIQSRKLGADQLLTSLEGTASHAFQVSARHAVEAVDLPHTLIELYSSHVGHISDSISIPD
jgi:hypothetical protein